MRLDMIIPTWRRPDLLRAMPASIARPQPRFQVFARRHGEPREQLARERLSKRYHRAWHRGHGRFYALMRDPSFERTSLGTLLGVPAHVYRALLGELAARAASMVLLQRSAAFAHELRVRFLAAFARERIFRRI
jgi:hypothetical protein